MGYSVRCTEKSEAVENRVRWSGAEVQSAMVAHSSSPVVLRTLNGSVRCYSHVLQRNWESPVSHLHGSAGFGFQVSVVVKSPAEM